MLQQAAAAMETACAAMIGCIGCLFDVHWDANGALRCSQDVRLSL